MIPIVCKTEVKANERIKYFHPRLIFNFIQRISFVIRPVFCLMRNSYREVTVLQHHILQPGGCFALIRFFCCGLASFCNVQIKWNKKTKCTTAALSVYKFTKRHRFYMYKSFTDRCTVITHYTLSFHHLQPYAFFEVLCPPSKNRHMQNCINLQIHA